MINFKELKDQYSRFSFSEKVSVLERLIPGIRDLQGGDYIALNPRRDDRELGSFRIDIETGKFNDFASDDKGGDIIDLTALAYGCDLPTAARKLSDIIGSPSSITQIVAAANAIASCSEITPLAKKKKIDPGFIWSRSAKSDHEYFKQKHISIGNARVNCYRGRKQLVVPLTDFIPENETDFCIKGLQFIQEDGSKKFPTLVKGLFYIASGYSCQRDTIILVEGYATACSIAESTELYTIAAMSACNMKAVALRIRELLPNSKIIIAADNDEAGIKAAKDTSRTLGCNVQIIRPTYENDFNDMLVKTSPDDLRFFVLQSIEKETVDA
jgi:putative DNA primase/helicase